MADATSNLKRTTQLEAVNVLLRCIGEGPISDEDTPQNVSAMNALETLRRVSKEVQNRGWWFNHETDVTLAKDQDGRIPVGNDILEIDTWGRDAHVNVTMRGSYLYNLSDNTYEFDRNVKVERIVLLSFEDLPESARQYITIKAAREFKMNEVGEDAAGFGFTQADEIQALMTLKNQEGNNAGHNILTGSYGTAKIIDRTGVYGDSLMNINTKWR